jgi:hypothetical protein
MTPALKYSLARIQAESHTTSLKIEWVILSSVEKPGSLLLKAKSALA